MSYQNTNQNMISAKKAEIANLQATLQKRQVELKDLERVTDDISTCSCSECTGIVKPLEWLYTPSPNRLFDLGSPRPRPRTQFVYGYDDSRSANKPVYGSIGYDSDSDDDILPARWARPSWYSYVDSNCGFDDCVQHTGYDSDEDLFCQCDSCDPRDDEVEIPQPSKEATTTKLETSQRKFKEKRTQKERKRAKGCHPVTHGLQKLRSLWRTEGRRRRRADVKAQARVD